MNPILFKVLIVFVLTVTFLIFFMTAYLLVKNYLRPLVIRVFMRKKILKTAEIILKAQKDNEAKVKGLVNANMTDLDLIRIAEEEIQKADRLRIKQEQERNDQKSQKLGFWNKLKIWRKNDGKKESIRQDSRREDQGDAIAKTDAGAGRVEEKRAGDVVASSGAGRDAEGSLPKFDSSDEGFRPVQSESIEVAGRKRKYFN